MFCRYLSPVIALIFHKVFARLPNLLQHCCQWEIFFCSPLVSNLLSYMSARTVSSTSLLQGISLLGTKRIGEPEKSMDVDAEIAVPWLNSDFDLLILFVLGRNVNLQPTPFQLSSLPGSPGEPRQVAKSVSFA